MSSLQSPRHTPVLLTEVLQALQPAAGEFHIDLTVGLGGHASQVLQRLGAKGLLLGVDRDAGALELAAERLDAVGFPYRLRQGPYSRVAEFLREVRDPPESSVDGVLLDLGVSSFQLERADRGFSFQLEGPLEMRMDPTTGRSAGELLRSLDEGQLEKVLRDLGEEPRARRIARAVLAAERRGELRTTADLARVVERACPRAGRRIHPATRTFQALRMAVNQELDELESVLRDLDRWLRPGGRAVVLSYHSLEDRAVKQAFGRRVKEGVFHWLNEKPIQPSEGEVKSNPRSRSARMRAVMRAGGTPAHRPG